MFSEKKEVFKSEFSYRTIPIDDDHDHLFSFCHEFVSLLYFFTHRGLDFRLTPYFYNVLLSIFTGLLLGVSLCVPVSGNDSKTEYFNEKDLLNPHVPRLPYLSLKLTLFAVKK